MSTRNARTKQNRNAYATHTHMCVRMLMPFLHIAGHRSHLPRPVAGWILNVATKWLREWQRTIVFHSNAYGRTETVCELISICFYAWTWNIVYALVNSQGSLSCSPILCAMCGSTSNRVPWFWKRLKNITTTVIVVRFCCCRFGICHSIMGDCVPAAMPEADDTLFGWRSLKTQHIRSFSCPVTLKMSRKALSLFGGAYLINWKWNIVVSHHRHHRRRRRWRQWRQRQRRRKEAKLFLLIATLRPSTNTESVMVCIERAEQPQTAKRNLSSRQKATTVPRIVS